MSFITTALGAILSPLTIDHAVWYVKLDNGRFLSERDSVVDEPRGFTPNGKLGRLSNRRSFDWSLDLVATGDVLRVRELGMVCPPNPTSWTGNTARLPIIEPGTAFQFKVRHLSLGAGGQPQFHLIIGRVDNKETGDCTCFIWDFQEQGMSAPFQGNVYNFPSWRPGIGRIGALGLDVLGLSLH